MVWLQKLWRMNQGFRTTQRPCRALALCLDGPSGQTPASRATHRTCSCCPLPLLLLTLMLLGSQQGSQGVPQAALSGTIWSLLAAQTAVFYLLLGQGNMDCILGAAHKLINYSFWHSYSLGHQSRLTKRFEKWILYVLVKIWHPFGDTDSVFVLAFQFVLYHKFPMAVKANTTM